MRCSATTSVGTASRPGQGVTPPYALLLDDVGLLLGEADKHFPGKPRFLYGHSMGGNLVLNYALQRKAETGFLSGLIATSPALRAA